MHSDNQIYQEEVLLFSQLTLNTSALQELCPDSSRTVLHTDMHLQVCAALLLFHLLCQQEAEEGACTGQVFQCFIHPSLEKIPYWRLHKLFRQPNPLLDCLKRKKVLLEPSLNLSFQFVPVVLSSNYLYVGFG